MEILGVSLTAHLFPSIFFSTSGAAKDDTQDEPVHLWGKMPVTICRASGQKK